jgi:hypothetical protein
VLPDESFDLDMEGFLPKNTRHLAAGRHSYPETEAESLSALMRGHGRMMKIFTS